MGIPKENQVPRHHQLRLKLGADLLKAVKLLACCLLIFPLAGTPPFPVPQSRTRLLGAQPKAESLPAAIAALQREVDSLWRQRRFAEAIPLCERIHRDAAAAGLMGLAASGARFTGACQFALRRHTAALASFLEARGLAEAAGDEPELVACDLNIASLYSEIGEVDAAAHWAQELLGRLRGEPGAKHEAKLLILLGSLRARQQRMPEAEELFARGIAAADRSADLVTYAHAWNRLGEEYLKQHNIPAAEGPLLEAYRIRKLNHFPLDTSYRNLGLLRLEQGDLAAASVLLDRTVELSMLPHPVLALYDGFHHRGRLRLVQGRLREAMEDLRIAVRLAREWRWSVPPDDAARMGSEGWLEKVHSALVEAGNRLYLETHDPALLRETFEAAEENRASSLRALLASRDESPAAKLPASYWDALDRLQRAEIQALRSKSARDQESVSAIRAELTRMEMPLGRSAAPLTADLLDRTGALLAPDAALLSFQLGESASWLWALDRKGLTLHRLPPRVEVEQLARTVTEAVRTDSAQADITAEQLYRTLFGAREPRFQSKARWMLALDHGLFELPIATLRAGGQYLCELHTIEIIPGAGAWVEAAARPVHPASRFLGVGDAIYNTADPRLPSLYAVSPSKGLLLLPRLVASGREVEGCARIWGGERVLLEGASASRANLVRELARDPAVVHLATHVLPSGERPAHGLIALSLNPRGENELVPPQEIAS